MFQLCALELSFLQLHLHCSNLGLRLQYVALRYNTSRKTRLCEIQGSLICGNSATQHILLRLGRTPQKCACLWRESFTCFM